MDNILSKKVTHNRLVYRQARIIVAVTCILYISYVVQYKEKILRVFGRFHAFEEKKIVKTVNLKN